MVAAQLALTIVLLAGAGLMLKSVWRMTSYPAGFTPDRILTMRMDFRGPQLRADRARYDLAAALLARAQSLPGVRQAAITTGRDSMTLVLKEGDPMPAPDERERKTAPVSAISADFGPTLGMPLVSGRWFEEIEPAGVVLINEALARRDFPEGPLGRRIRTGDAYATIVGVVADMKYLEIDAEPPPELFVHYANTRLFGITLALQIDGDPAVAAASIRKELSTIDPTQTFYSVRTMEDALAESIAPRRFNLLLLSTFAIVALVLAALGVYSVVAYAVSERTQEIGIRLALGAQRARVVRMIVGQGMLSVSAGIIVGLVGAVAATRWIAGLLYGVQPTDAPTFIWTATILAAIAFIACAAPALKAALVDPVTALRAE
jgi:putative ABC transport system permease protein